MHPSLSAHQVTLGLLAGGRAARLGGIDKAWLRRDGEPQVLRLRDCYRDQVAAVCVSANHGLARYAAAGLAVVPDRAADAGPLGGLDALLHACDTPWLLTLPVDVLAPPDDLLSRLAHAASADRGAFARDADGPQPLVALWPVAAAREAVATALQAGERAVHRVQAALAMAGAAWPDVRFGNLNTFDDLHAAGVVPDPEP